MIYICLFIMDDPRDIGHGPSPRTARIGAKAARMIRVLRLVAASGRAWPYNETWGNQLFIAINIDEQKPAIIYNGGFYR